MKVSRRHCVAWGVLAWAVGPGGVSGQQKSDSGEIALRAAIKDFFAAWNARDIDAWKAFLTDDIVWMLPYGVEKKGYAEVMQRMPSEVRMYDVRFDVSRLRLDPQATEAVVLLRGVMQELPVVNGRYTREYVRDPWFGRWRLESGRWKLFYMNSATDQAEPMARAEGLIK